MSDEAAEGPEFPAAPPPDPTGHPRVDAALALLGELGGRPVAAHVEVFEDVHQRLQELLAAAEPGRASRAAPARLPRRPAPP
ncbi:hypothetical protein ACFQY7_08530 [Actinomadura luteofluorescens]|uniref:hypothetical protein n=1 Tax=Actinomadura luteofluorescens TaxID=46163 RepID=UPI00363977F1